MGALVAQGDILQSDRDLNLLKSTSVASELTPIEFNHFVHMCRKWRLDPLRRQIYAIVFKRRYKDDDDNWKTRRQVTYITGIDGYRTIADRTGCYRPGKVTVECDPELKDPDLNPHGVVSATATVWKNAQASGTSMKPPPTWDEYAPLKEIWEYDQDKNKRVPTGKFVLDTSGQWGKMGRHMLRQMRRSARAAPRLAGRSLRPLRHRGNGSAEGRGHDRHHADRAGRARRTTTSAGEARRAITNDRLVRR